MNQHSDITPDFRTLFESAPGLYLVLDTELRIIAVTDAYLRATLTQREHILGKVIFDVFPENPEDPEAGGVGILKASLHRVLRDRVEDVMAIQKYDIPRPESAGGGFEARYWSPFNSPVLAADGSLVCIIHRAEDVTEFVRLKQSSDNAPTADPGARSNRLEAEIYARAREVADARNTLEQHVAERTKALEVANASLQESQRAALQLAEDAVVARENAEQALAQTQRLLRHLQLLDQITRYIGERLDSASIFQVVVQTLEDSMPLDFACVCLYEPVANHLNVQHRGSKNVLMQEALGSEGNFVIPVDSNGLSRCINGKLVYEPDIAEVDFPFPAMLARCGLRSLVLAPLRLESRIFGVLVAARSQASAFTSGACEFLRQLSEHVALSIQQAQLYATLQQAYKDLQATQQAAMQQERLRALGQMASGIAHDINNALSPVALYTESLLETEPGLSEKARNYLQVIQRAVEDVAETVARMREFYRQRDTQLELAPVDANSLVLQVLDLTRARWSDMQQKHGVVIHAKTELAMDLPKFMGVESEIREALTNLIFNAVDAMPEGGTLTLRTRLSVDTGQTAVAIEVGDTGIGMDEDTRQRCLEPFFTTKGERGTGLGLAMVFGMVQRHSSAMEVDSSPGSGTTFRLIFGVDDRESGASTTAPQGSVPAPVPLRLLLVDDDPVLLKSLRDALESDGHMITTANGGEAGINAFRSALTGGAPFSAVITDLGMPNIDGRRVAAAVKEASRSTPVLLLTGWGQRLVADGEIPPGVDQVLAKPPKLKELRQALVQLCPQGDAG